MSNAITIETASPTADDRANRIRTNTIAIVTNPLDIIKPVSSNHCFAMAPAMNPGLARNKTDACMMEEQIETIAGAAKTANGM